MACLTAMTLQEGHALVARYGLRLVELEAVQHGSVNSNFRLTLHDGQRLFARVCEESVASEVEAQNALLQHLVLGGVPTPAPLAMEGGVTVAEHAGKPVVLFPHCAGDWICQQRVDASRLEIIGAAVGRLHEVGRDYQAAPRNRFDFSSLRQRLEQLSARAQRGELAAELVADIELLVARVDEVEPIVAASPADSVIHGDVFRDNVLWHDDGRLSAIVDFESASRGNTGFDLMVTMLAWCFGDHLDQALARALVRGYARERVVERAFLLGCYQQARAAALRFAVTRITDYELRPRGVVVFKDYRRFMARLRAIEAIAEADFPQWIRV